MNNKIHCFPYKDTWLAIDTVSLANFVCRKEMYQYLHGETIDGQAALAIKKQLNDYKATGYFANDSLPESMEAYNSSYVISVQNTLECPLNCKYCFSKKIQSPQKEMTQEMADKVLKFVFDKFDSRADVFEFYFTSGGEPLANFPIIKDLYRKVKMHEKDSYKKVRVGLTTNSVLLNDDIYTYLDKEKIAVALSIDGNKEQHDANRVFYNGRGTYDLVLAALNKLKSSRNPYINNPLGLAVLTDKTDDYIAVVKNLVDAGFNTIALKPVKNCDGPDVDLEYLFMVKKRYGQLIEFLTEELLNNRWKYVMPLLNTNDFMGQLLTRILQRKKVIYRCDAGKSRYSILPNGEIYPCDYFSTSPETKLGTVEEGIDEEKNKYWQGNHCLNQSECGECWARYICGGTCYYMSYINNGRPDTFECELKKDLIENLIGLKYTLKKENVKVYRHLCEQVKKNEENQIYNSME